MIVTKEIVLKGKSTNGGWSRGQFEALGLKWPLESGWMRRIVGRDLDDKDIEKFLSLKDQHIKKKKAQKLSVSRLSRMQALESEIIDADGVTALQNLMESMKVIHSVAERKELTSVKVFNLLYKMAKRKEII